MNALILAVVLIGNYTVTSYRSVPEQTDDSPWITSTGERVNEHGVAVSQDLLESGMFKYGDLIYVEDIGFKVVNDTMNIRIKNHIDVWVQTYDQEKKFDKQFANRKLQVWRVRRDYGAANTSHQNKKKAQR